MFRSLVPRSSWIPFLDAYINERIRMDSELERQHEQLFGINSPLTSLPTSQPTWYRRSTSDSGPPARQNRSVDPPMHNPSVINSSYDPAYILKNSMIHHSSYPNKTPHNSYVRHNSFCPPSSSRHFLQFHTYLLYCLIIPQITFTVLHLRNILLTCNLIPYQTQSIVHLFLRMLHFCKLPIQLFIPDHPVPIHLFHIIQTLTLICDLLVHIVRPQLPLFILHISLPTHVLFICETTLPI